MLGNDPRYGHEQASPGLEDSMERSHGSAHVVDVLESLGADDAVEAVRGKLVTFLEPAGVVGLRAAHHVQHVAAANAIASEHGGVQRLADLEYTPADLGRVVAEEALDVSATDGVAVITSPVARARRKPRHN